MLKARDFFDQEILWQINCGHSSIIYDNWTQFGALYYHLFVSYSNERMEKDVEYLLNDGVWDECILKDNLRKLLSILPEI